MSSLPLRHRTPDEFSRRGLTFSEKPFSAFWPHAETFLLLVERALTICFNREQILREALGEPLLNRALFKASSACDIQATMRHIAELELAGNPQYRVDSKGTNCGLIRFGPREEYAVRFSCFTKRGNGDPTVARSESNCTRPEMQRQKGLIDGRPVVIFTVGPCRSGEGIYLGTIVAIERSFMVDKFQPVERQRLRSQIMPESRDTQSLGRFRPRKQDNGSAS